MWEWKNIWRKVKAFWWAILMLLLGAGWLIAGFSFKGEHSNLTFIGVFWNRAPMYVRENITYINWFRAGIAILGITISFAIHHFYTVSLQKSSEMGNWLLAASIASILLGSFLVKEISTIEFTYWGSGVVAIFTLILLHFRFQNQEKQTKIQTEELKIQTRKELNDSTALLGNSETSAQTQAIYSLYYLAIESEKYRGQIADILCAYIRSKTEKDEYREKHISKPSNEIQTAIHLLFNKYGGKEGLYLKFSDLPAADLSSTYLVGVLFTSGAQCQSVNFMCANLQNVAFSSANYKKANFSFANCQGAILSGHSHNSPANFQEASFMHANCQGARCRNSDFQGANFSHAKCQGAEFNGADLRGAYALDASTLIDNINQDTKIDTMIISGKLDPEDIAAIDKIKEHMPKYWQNTMQKVIDDNKDKPIKRGKPRGEGIKFRLPEEMPGVRSGEED